MTTFMVMVMMMMMKMVGSLLELGNCKTCLDTRSVQGDYLMSVVGCGGGEKNGSETDRQIDDENSNNVHNKASHRLDFKDYSRSKMKIK